MAFLVEGGTITDGKEGIIGATGDALTFIDIATGAMDTSASDEAAETENPSPLDGTDEPEDSSASDEARKLSPSMLHSRQVYKGTEQPPRERKLGATPKLRKTALATKTCKHLETWPC